LSFDRTRSRVATLNRLSVLFLLLPIAACHPTPKPQEQHCQLEGAVVKVDPANHEITINHKAVPGFIEAMTMPYGVKDDGELANVKVGERISADLVVVRSTDSVWVQHLRPIEHLQRDHTESPLV
jgi:Cu/Ag efflux protein CusF